MERDQVVATLNGEQIYLRPLILDDANSDYVAWMNDYEIVKYTESRFFVHTQKSIEEFIYNSNNTNSFIFAIIAKKEGLHIGNIKLGGIDWNHHYGNIGLIIGRKEFHRRGIATEAIQLLTDYAFQHFNLHKVLCGAYEPNIGSICAFQKAGFEIYAKTPCHYLFEGKYIDCIHLHKINRTTDIE
jgi:RimJ/RimL family protein N-acetyltransferase